MYLQTIFALLTSIDPRDPIYLTLVNLLLGLMVIVLVSLIAVVVFMDINHHHQELKKKLAVRTDLKDILSKLGVVMRDGGEQVNPEKKGGKK